MSSSIPSELNKEEILRNRASADASLLNTEPEILIKTVETDDVPPSKSIKQLRRENNDTESFGVMDFLRLLGGFLGLFLMLSYYTTGTATFGYHTKFEHPRYIKSLFMPKVSLTDSQLASYDGSNPQTPIYVAISGRVYDVTNGKDTYGPGGSYQFFAGRDAARAFSNGCFNDPSQLTWDLRGLDEEKAASDIKGWQDFYDNDYRYWYVGEVVHEPLRGPPPSLVCKGYGSVPKHVKAEAETVTKNSEFE
ncbi:cytochrome b5 [Nadsonia fulvescens var. elongata DSM 6958]|uniref:Cytochrome b5 n=1 Tax=Nadsonia fulvescens var. elongata DSM 6958 TaxID=857566 RepID=A0A1E3PIC0_9ASCO|nr:cytochrome b5 [Nadsonia fulvescens var. elongata DSM 6958]